MPVNSILLQCRRDIQSRTARTLVSVGAALVLCSPLAALAQTKTFCGPEVKAEVAQALAGVEDASEAEKLAVEADLYTKYQPAQDAELVPADSFLWPRASAAPPSPTSAASSTRK